MTGEKMRVYEIAKEVGIPNKDLIAKIRAFINGWNPRAHPFIWTKPADQILDRINRNRISTTSH